MASAPIIDLEKLLAPIPGDEPAGADLKADPSPTSLYYKVKDAREKARTDERRLVEGGDEAADVRPDWNPVLEFAVEALTEKSKNLQVAAYLVECLVRKHGFAGLRDGMRLIAGLTREFWDQGLHPQPDEDETAVEARGPFLDLGVLVLDQVQMIPLTAEGSVGPYALAHYKQATELSRLDTAKRAEREKMGAVTSEKWELAVRETGADFFAKTVEIIDGALEAYSELDRAIEEKCGPDGPSAAELRETLEQCKRTVSQYYAPQAEPTAEAPAEGQTEVAATDSPARPAAAPPANAPMCASEVRDREDAFQSVLKIADFFERTEPHSPLGPALKQAVRWGKMPFAELFAELIPKADSREYLFKMVGVAETEDKAPAKKK